MIIKMSAMYLQPQILRPAPNYISFTEKIQPYITIIFGKHFNLVLFCIYITTNYIYEQMVAVFRQKDVSQVRCRKRGKKKEQRRRSSSRPRWT